jgi:ribonuclease VapC
MFVDASALAAILLDEPDGRDLARALESAPSAERVTSAIAVFETALAVNRTEAGGIERAAQVVKALLHRAGVAVGKIDGTTGDIAIGAHALYGKGSGHPARLNLGDCFAYAMAKQHGVPLLYKGEDFALTDLA